jgi:DNA-binding Xre family transcriptional regulator
MVDGADITAVIPRYSNRLVDPRALDELLSRKRTALFQLCDSVGIAPKTMWRFRQRHRVLPVATGWRITSALTCRIDDFSDQHDGAHNVARINAILWEAREFSPVFRTMLMDQLVQQAEDRHAAA